MTAIPPPPAIETDAPVTVKAVDLALRRILPERYHDIIGDLDSKNINAILAAVAKEDADIYPEVVKRIADLGREAAYVQGETLRLEDLRPPFDRRPVFEALDRDMDALRAEDLPEDEFRTRRAELYGRYANMLRDLTMDAASAADNNLIYGILSGARGKPDQMVSMITTPSLYTDYRGDIVPLFVRHSYAEGLRPGEYLASTFGSRSSVIDMKGATAEGGDIGKQLNTIGSRVVVREDDCGTTNGIDFDADESSLTGRVLARPVGGLEPGTILDRDALGTISRSRPDTVVVRSPLTCQTPNGICSKCAGADTRGRLRSIGDSVGNISAQVVGERLAQGALSSKHCLAEGTEVRMADFTVKRIEDIRVGDTVLGADIHGNTFPVAVLNVWDQGVQQVREYAYAYDEEFDVAVITCTEDHQILDASGETFVKKPIREVEATETSDGRRYSLVDVGDERTAECWDLEVDHPDELFVLANGLVVKNSAGVFTGVEAEYSGLPIINQILQSPRMFPHKAQVSEVDGTVDAVETAPQGGTYVQIEGKRHYVPPRYPVTVVEGDVLEAGDLISEGLIDVKDILALKGLGEGRRTYAEQLQRVLRASGVSVNLRDTEMLARSAIDHLRISGNEDYGGFLPDDVVSYNSLASSWEPPEDTRLTSIDELRGGEYLQAPALHYAVGDRLTPSKISRLRSAGWTEVPTSSSPAPFTPEMSRLRIAASENYPDWMARLSGSYLQKYLEDSAVRGHDAAYRKSDHFAGPLAHAAEFGETTRETGKF